MKKLLSLVAFIMLTNLCSGQKLHFNFYVDTLDLDVKKSVHFLEDYIAAFGKDSLPDFKKYWSPQDCRNYNIPDQMVYAISGDYPTYKMKCKRTVLYIKPDAEYINIKTNFAFVDSSNEVSILCVTNHYIKFDKDFNPYFINPLDINTKTWQHRKVRNVRFVYPPAHKFDQKKADSLIASITALEKNWNLQPIDIRYFFADSYEDLLKVRGFDYTCNMGNRNKAQGISDDRDNIVYCGALGENYFHEVVHIYMYHLFPNSPLKEGLAVFYGGSIGHPLSWHLARLKKYLNSHPEIDLNKWDDLGYIYLDNNTNFKSTMLGLLCETAFKKDGINGLKKIMSYKSLDEIFLKQFNTQPGTGDKFLRQLVDRQ